MDSFARSAGTVMDCATAQAEHAQPEGQAPRLRQCKRCNKWQPLEREFKLAASRNDPRGEPYRRHVCRDCDAEARRRVAHRVRGPNHIPDSVGCGYDGSATPSVPGRLDATAEIRCRLKAFGIIAIGRCHAMQKSGECPRVCERFAQIAAEAVK